MTTKWTEYQGATSGGGTFYPSWAHAFTSSFCRIYVAQVYLYFCVVFCRSLFVLLSPFVCHSMRRKYACTNWWDLWFNYGRKPLLFSMSKQELSYEYIKYINVSYKSSSFLFVWGFRGSNEPITTRCCTLNAYLDEVHSM